MYRHARRAYIGYRDKYRRTKTHRELNRYTQLGLIRKSTLILYYTSFKKLNEVVFDTFKIFIVSLHNSLHKDFRVYNTLKSLVCAWSDKQFLFFTGGGLISSILQCSFNKFNLTMLFALCIITILFFVKYRLLQD